MSTGESAPCWHDMHLEIDRCRMLEELFHEHDRESIRLLEVREEAALLARFVSYKHEVNSSMQRERKAWTKYEAACS